MLGSFQWPLLLWPLFVWAQHPSSLHLHVCTTYNTCIHTHKATSKYWRKQGHFFQIDYFGFIVRKTKGLQVGFSLGRMERNLISVSWSHSHLSCRAWYVLIFSHLEYTQYEQFEGHRYAFYPWSIVTPQPEGHGVLCQRLRLPFREQVLCGTWPDRCPWRRATHFTQLQCLFSKHFLSFLLPG